MMEIVYIGPKEKKVDKLTGSRMVFPRFKPMNVKDEFAEVLLNFPTVYIPADQLEEFKEKFEAKEKSDMEAKQKAEEEAKKQAEAQLRVVVINGEDVDLRKYTEVQLRTFVEANDLNVPPKQSGEKVAEYGDRVFEAYQQKQSEGDK